MRRLRGRFVDGVFEPAEPIDLGGDEPERRNYFAHVQALLAGGRESGGTVLSPPRVQPLLGVKRVLPLPVSADDVASCLAAPRLRRV